MLIAFGIAGTVLKDLTKEPLARNDKGEDVYLRDIWPSKEEINEAIRKSVSVDLFEKEYGQGIVDVNPYWNNLSTPKGVEYAWEKDSTYIRLPPFFDGFDPSQKRKVAPINNARVLAVFGDSISTDHISPAGAIGKDSPAGKYL
ncbi:aconitate hydratase 1, partial [mine drainage metagenome]